MDQPPSLVFVPGSWHQPTSYERIIEILQKEYHLKCIPITLPSTTGNRDATFKDDVDAARGAITSELDLGHNVVVIAHSYGGMVGNSAIKNLTRRHSVGNSEAGRQQFDRSQCHVIGLVLIASGFTLTGLSFMDPFFGIPPPSWRANWDTGFAELVTTPRELFYHDLHEEEANYWVSQLKPQCVKALFEGGEFAYAGWMDVPVWYIGTAEDRGLPVTMQRIQVGMARGMGGAVEHKEMQTSHSPFLSRPKEVADIMIDAVSAFTGQPTRQGAFRAGHTEIVVPGAKLWQPYTWFKFGGPLVLGHIIGRGYLVFHWVKNLWQSG